MANPRGRTRTWGNGCSETPRSVLADLACGSRDRKGLVCVCVCVRACVRACGRAGGRARGWARVGGAWGRVGGGACVGARAWGRVGVGAWVWARGCGRVGVGAWVWGAWVWARGCGARVCGRVCVGACVWARVCGRVCVCVFFFPTHLFDICQKVSASLQRHGIVGSIWYGKLQAMKLPWKISARKRSLLSRHVSAVPRQSWLLVEPEAAAESHSP